MHGCNWLLLTVLLTDVPEADNLKLWLCIIWSLGMIPPVLLIVFWSLMLSGASKIPLVLLIFKRGRGRARAKSWVASLLTISWRRVGFDNAPLWFPKVNASLASCRHLICLIHLEATQTLLQGAS